MGRAVVDSLPANSFRLSQKHGCTPAQLALAWVLHQGDDVALIPGTTKIKHLNSNIDALRLKLREEDLKEITDVISLNEIVRARIPEKFVHLTWKYGNTPRREKKKKKKKMESLATKAIEGL
ncbi:hypothetical protein V6N13_088269 [Hibiscus sabdariffa]